MIDRRMKGPSGAATAAGPHRRRRSAPAIVAAVVTGVALFGGVSSAWAGTALSVPPNIPSPNGGVVVGSTGVASSMTVQNGSNGAQAGLTVTLSNITLVPSCGTLVIAGDCPIASVDPGVFKLSSTAVGEANSVCAGDSFTVTKIDATQDKYQFTPTTPVVLGRANDASPAGLIASQCTIDFTVDVLKVPTKDARPDAGIQTGELGSAGGTASDLVVGGGVGTNFTTVSPGTIGLKTQVSPTTLALGSPFHDTATVTSTAGAATPTGSIRFDVYNNATCTGTPTFTSTNALNAAGTTAASANFTPTVAGTYHVIATYSGDANWNALASACADPAEALVVTPPVVTPPPPPVVTPPPPPPVVPPCTPPPGTPPPGGSVCVTPPPEACTPPPGPAPSGGKLCARGTAAIRGTNGCAGTPFRVVVNGKQIKTVVFTLDGKVLRTLSKPNVGSLYVLPVNPRTLTTGVHRVLARTIFRKDSGTKSRTLRVTFSRCARRAVSPAFTG